MLSKKTVLYKLDKSCKKKKTLVPYVLSQTIIGDYSSNNNYPFKLFVACSTYLIGVLQLPKLYEPCK